MSPHDTSLFLSIWAPTLVGALFAFAFGACAGSFLNVLVWRLPTGQSVVVPPSRCPLCGHRLAWHENIPVLGWIRLRGRCSACRARISPQYPLIEFFVGVLFAEAKKRAEAAEAFESAGRTESAAKERAEAAVIARYLPAAMGDDELAAIVAEEIASAAAAGLDGGKAMGQVVKAVRARAGAGADGGKIAAMVKSALGQGG
jgi:uncharacterized protein YqeY